MGDPIATFGFELLEESHPQVHVNWGHEAMGRQIRNQKSEIKIANCGAKNLT